MRRLRIREGIGKNPVSWNEAIVDQLGDEVFGIPPSLRTGLLTGLVGAAAGGVSLLIYFYLWQADYYNSLEWLLFIALGGIMGLFLRLEQPLFRELYHRKVQTLRQAEDASEDMRMQIGFEHKIDLDR